MPDELRSDEAAETAPLDFPVVGVGASAGGLGAFTEFLKHLPAEPGMAFVLVQHLDPDHESELPELLQRATPMTVRHVGPGSDGTAVEPNQVYVISPGRNLTIRGGTLYLSEMERDRAERAPIDHFLRSLAESQGARAIGVVLSGTGSGGTMGLRHIKERGGLTLAQLPEEAEFEQMPRSAVHMGVVDVVASARELAERLPEYVEARARIRLPEVGDRLNEDDAEALSGIFEVLEEHTGHSFSQYKRSTMLRRIGRRMQVQEIADLPAYLDFLRLEGLRPARATPRFEEVRLSTLETYAPPGILVSEQNEIAHVFEGGDRYLRVAQGAPTYDVLEMIHPVLRPVLRTTLFQARNEAQETRSRAVPLTDGGQPCQVRCVAHPVAGSGFVQVVFERIDEEDDRSPGAAPAGEDERPHDVDARDSEVKQLEEELAASRRDLQATVEEYESATEEQRASSEELQSINEELTTVNFERRAEETLRESEQRLQLAQDTARLGTWRLDVEDDAFSYSDLCKAQFGRAPEDAFGYDDFLEAIHPDDRSAKKQAVRKALDTGEEYEMECRIPQADGGPRWIYVRGRPVRKGGAIVALLGVTLDVTERKRREEELERRVEERTREVRAQATRFEALVDASAQIVWWTDATGRIASDSPSWKSFTGQSTEEWAGDGWSNAVHPDERERVLLHWRACVEAERPMNIEFRLYHAESDTWRWVNARAAPLPNAAGDVRGWMGMNIDIDERKRAERRVRQLVYALTGAEERERRRIAGVLHDDLQQQLYGAEMTARRARRLAESRPVKDGESSLESDTRAEVIQMCDRLDDILNDAAETVRTLSSELSPAVLREEDLARVFEWLSGHMEERHGLRVGTAGLEGPLPIKSRQLRTFLLRIARELLFNVLKHAHVSRATLAARAEEDRLVIRVFDEGAGFDRETLEAREEGSYGLSNMRERLHFLGGHLHLESAPEEGTRVTITLPSVFTPGKTTTQPSRSPS